MSTIVEEVINYVEEYGLIGELEGWNVSSDCQMAVRQDGGVGIRWVPPSVIRPLGQGKVGLPELPEPGIGFWEIVGERQIGERYQFQILLHCPERC